MESEVPLVVVIDDEPVVLEAMKKLLQRVGFEVLAATTAEEILTDLEESGESPDVIFADHQLGDSRVGADAIRLIRQTHGAAVPGIIVTGDMSPDRIQQAQADGIRILHKPLRSETLKTVVTDVLQRGS